MNRRAWSIVKRFRFWILGSLLWLTIVHISFLFIQDSQAKSLMNAIHGQLRQDLSISNFQFMSRNLSDLETLRAIKCINFTQLSPSPKLILSTSFRGNCRAQSILLNGAYVESPLTALNGDIYKLSFISLNNYTFTIALWFIRIIGILLITSFYLYQKEKSEKDRVLYELDQKHTKMLIEVATQTSHDIRSPLSALSMVVGTLSEIPEDKRILIRNATQRINDIANDLLQKGKKNIILPLTSTEQDLTEDNPSQIEKFTGSIEYIPTLVDMLVSEKRMQYREYYDLEIAIDSNSSFGAFSMVNSIELKRALSNLINNSVEALTNHQGKVNVGVKKILLEQSEKVEIFIQDNGRGIPSSIQNKLGKMGVSYGKSGTESGSGLGIYHAKKTIDLIGGSFQIKSNKTIGTLIQIILPLSSPPAWFAKEIDLTNTKYLVSLDDDISIHQIWASKLKNSVIKNIEHIPFQSGEEFYKYVSANINKLRQTYFLIDYELLNQSNSGLDLIENLGIEKYSTLVTSHFEDPSLQIRANQLKLPILPKTLAPQIPFNFLAHTSDNI